MKKIFLTLVAMILISFAFGETFNWNTMNGDPNILKGFSTNLEYATKRGDIPSLVAKRMMEKWQNNDVQFFEIPYGYKFFGMMYYGKSKSLKTPKVFSGDVIMRITTLKDSLGNVVQSNKSGIPIYSKVIKDTLKYEEAQKIVDDFIQKNQVYNFLNLGLMDIEYTILYFGYGYAKTPQCNNFCIGIRLVPRKEIQIVREPYPVPEPYPVYRDSVRIERIEVEVESPVKHFTPRVEADAWINSSFTQLYRDAPDSVYTPGVISYNITRNYNAKKSFDLLGGARARVIFSEHWNFFAEIGGGVKDGIGEADAKIGVNRVWKTSAGDLSLGLNINPMEYQVVYWTYEKFNIISPHLYSIRSRQHKPWVEGINLGGELKIASEKDYALIEGSFNPRQSNNSLGVEAKTEKNIYGFFLGNMQNYSPNEFVDTDTLIVIPERNDYLVEAKLGLKIKKLDSGNVFLFGNGRINHQEIQQPRMDGKEYLYEYIRTDVGAGVQFPFYWENAQVILTYVDIKDGDWKNYGWCIRVIWNIF